MARVLKRGKAKAKKKSDERNRCKLPRGKKSHKGMKMNKWSEDRMRCATAEFHRGILFAM